MSTPNKIPSKQFREQTGKSEYQQCRLLKRYPQLKCRVAGEKGLRIDMNEWNKILKTA